MQLTGVVPDGAEQVRLPESRRAIDEERVVRGARRIGNGARGRRREAIRGADDEVVEAEPAVEHVLPPCRSAGGGTEAAQHHFRRAAQRLEDARADQCVRGETRHRTEVQRVVELLR